MDTQTLSRLAGVPSSDASNFLATRLRSVPRKSQVKIQHALSQWEKDGPTRRVYRLLADGECLDQFRDFHRTGDSRLSSTIQRLRDKLEAVPELGDIQRSELVVTEKTSNGPCVYYIPKQIRSTVAPILREWAK